MTEKETAKFFFSVRESVVCCRREGGDFCVEEDSQVSLDQGLFST